MTAPCPTCARLAAEAEILARLDWWAWWEKRRELEEHREYCSLQFAPDSSNIESVVIQAEDNR